MSRQDCNNTNRKRRRSLSILGKLRQLHAQSHDLINLNNNNNSIQPLSSSSSPLPPPPLSLVLLAQVSERDSSSVPTTPVVAAAVDHSIELDLTDCCRVYGVRIFSKKKEQQVYSSPLFTSRYQQLQHNSIFTYYNVANEDCLQEDEKDEPFHVLDELEKALPFPSATILSTATSVSHLIACLPSLLLEWYHPTSSYSPLPSSTVSQFHSCLESYLHSTPYTAAPAATTTTTTTTIMTIGYFPHQYGSSLGRLRFSSSIHDYQLGADPASVSLLCLQSPNHAPPLTSRFGKHLTEEDQAELDVREEALFQHVQQHLTRMHAFFFEPILCTQGVWCYRPAFVVRLFQLLTRAKICIIVDEALSGCGRSGTFLGLEQYGGVELVKQAHFILMGKAVHMPFLFTIHPDVLRRRDTFVAYCRNATTTFLSPHACLYTLHTIRFGLNYALMQQIKANEEAFRAALCDKDEKREYLYCSEQPMMNHIRSRMIGMMVYVSILTPVRVHMCAGRRLLPAYDCTATQCTELCSTDIRFRITQSNVYNCRSCGYCGDSINSEKESSVSCPTCTNCYHTTCMHFCVYCDRLNILSYFDHKLCIPREHYALFRPSLLKRMHAEEYASSVLIVDDTPLNASIFDSDHAWMHPNLQLCCVETHQAIPRVHIALRVLSKVIKCGTILMKVKTNNIMTSLQLRSLKQQYTHPACSHHLRYPISTHKPGKPYVALEAAGYQPRTNDFNLEVNPYFALVPSTQFANTRTMHHVWADKSGDLVVFAVRDLARNELLFDSHHDREYVVDS